MKVFHAEFPSSCSNETGVYKQCWGSFFPGLFLFPCATNLFPRFLQTNLIHLCH